MKTGRRRVWRILGATVGVLALMLVAAVSADLLFPAPWRPVDAVVSAARIAEVRPGKLEWAVLVDVSYEVAGRTYQGQGLRMVSDPQYAPVEAALADWRPGRMLTIYYDATNPAAVSRWADGGRQATSVLAALMVPVLLAIGFVIAALIRRRR